MKDANRLTAAITAEAAAAFSENIHVSRIAALWVSPGTYVTAATCRTPERSGLAGRRPDPELVPGSVRGSRFRPPLRQAAMPVRGRTEFFPPDSCCNRREAGS